MKIYLVGGAVRDELLGRPIVERDYVVVGATPAIMIKQGYKQVGKDFPVFLHPETHDEYALARTERKSGQGYGGFICDFEQSITLEQDLFRRDLTVNAIAKANDGQLIDPYHGQDDLNNRILRHVGPAFSEDPLRILRVARFAARYDHLGFTIADSTMKMMENMVSRGELKTLTQERIWLEIEKCLADGAIEHFTTTLDQLGALTDVQPLLIDWNVQERTQLKKLLMRLPHSHPHNKIIQFCLWLYDTPSDKLKALEQTLKIPSRYAVALRDFCEHKACFIPSVSAQQLLTLFDRIDLWRRPERFDLLLEIITFSQYNNPSLIALIKEAAANTRAIDVQAIIAAGFCGAQIKTQLTQQRLSTLKTTFN
ncbi:tRNA nucleotidyltransferase [Pseudoalteromonas aurantia]|uniref:tRNA nucleotidyltransferase (CCA-adding enzyme) n=1 Tax=Pseudoalteromonas aurantia 208 TaxID=1314867 RepID=A0ABR9E7Z2_9GAMM|nr:tRNA nucleotidyltransferase [Pseudoalteromonas aurantia]MBE0367109.1 tRNA nucleotidyltransferase (CCA-adding enzyme) [Pseudoalteromonas aurantia 208]